IAASEFYSNGKYNYKNFSKDQTKKTLTPKEQIALVNSWIKKYKLAYVEDPLHEEDFKGFSQLDKKTLICGDDLLTTNLTRLKKALRNKSVNSMIIKPNQIGSLIKTKKVVDFAHSQGIKTIISHRSGETLDNTISHLAVAWNIPYIKTGIYGKEREVKLKELLKIENEISS
ncbi:MAG: enolase C-terminal domain-like protein, partial [Nanoarchaeota archaeon]|nr:enolase C-terminal domain-like protein [Nanoarchaeota archaeon]